MAKSKVKLQSIAKKVGNPDYMQLYEYILREIENGHIQPVKNSGTNGKKPALYNSYWYFIKEKDYSELVDELKYKLNPKIDISFYINHLKQYEKDRRNVLKLSQYLDSYDDSCCMFTVNERSFDIFENEKYLDRKGGMKLLENCGFNKKKLRFYGTSEPMSYYSKHKRTPQKFLIIENKDTFYSMRKHLIEVDDNIMATPIGTLIYGAGKGIYKTFEDYDRAVETYFQNADNILLYFGDIDYEGILIYETLCRMYDSKIDLFIPAYRKCLEKAKEKGFDNMPIMKDGQNKSSDGLFIQQFTEREQELIDALLQSGHYIPQEILNENDWRS